MILRTIDERWNQRLRLDDLARVVALSPVRLRHLFKRETGKSLRKYILDYRLTKAAELLLSSDASIKEVCFQVGLSDQSNFQTSFKERFGLTPCGFRASRRRGVLSSTGTLNQ